MENLVIIGSSRKNGNTAHAVELVCKEHLSEVEIIDLNDHNISYFDYEHKNQGDDFLAIAEKMTEAKNIIFATPIYWYAMSGIMKTFFDRMSDMVTIKKELGKKMQGKNIFVIVVGANDHHKASFLYPFVATAKYLKMHYQGAFYYLDGKDTDIDELDEFTTMIFKK